MRGARCEVRGERCGIQREDLSASSVVISFDPLIQSWCKS